MQHKRTVRLQICNVSDKACTVSFEPLGGQAELSKGEIFDVEITGPGDGLVEVCCESDGISIGEWDGATTVARNQRGEQVGR